MLRSGLIIAAIAGLSACSTPPDLDVPVSSAAQGVDYPALLPAESLRAKVSTAPLEGSTLPRQEPIVAQAERIDNRADALRARAASLRGEVIDEDDRDRLDQEITIEDEEV